MAAQTGSTWTTRISVVVGLIVLGVIAALVVPAIYQARMEARRTQSKNNLKQLTLAVHNHNDVYQRLPSGARIADDGTALHGWFTRLLSFLASSSLYSQINRDLPWNHPLNRHNFMGSYYGHNIPGVEPWFSSKGYGTQHYLANPNAMHRDSRVVFDDMTGGTSNFWLFGEARPQFVPWGYPFNWREIEYPLGQDNGYGGPWGGTQFAMADGSVRFISDDIAQEVVELARDQPPIASAAARLRPNKTFGTGHEPERSVFNVGTNNGKPAAFIVVYSQDGVAETVCPAQQGKGEKPNRNITIGDIKKLAAAHPTLRELFVPGIALNDETLPVFASLQELEVLSVTGVNLSQDALAKLRAFKSLKVLKGWTPDETREGIRQALPDCELHFE